MAKTFIGVNTDDEVFFMKISNSKILVGEEGPILKAKVKNVIRTYDMSRASFAFIKPDGSQTTVTIDLGKTVHVAHKSQDEISLDIEIFGTDKKTMIARALAVMNERMHDIHDIKDKCNQNIDDLLIASAELETEQYSMDNEVSLEEAASMAM